MNTEKLESVFLYSLIECYKDPSNKALSKIADDLISVFYELGIGHKVDYILNKAEEELK